MKLRNLTDTIVLLYDDATMHGTINPGCVSVEIDDEIARKSQTIQRFLLKGIVEIVGAKAKDIAPAPRFVKESIIMTPKTTIDMVNVNGVGIPNENVRVANDGPVVIPGKTSIDYVPNIDSATVLVTNTKDIMGAEEKRVTDIINSGSEKVSRKLKASVDEIEGRKKAKAALEAKLANAPADVKEYLALRHMAKKWFIVKLVDVAKLKELATYEQSDAALKLIDQRLKELGV
jgi:hypothetical protein